MNERPKLKIELSKYDFALEFAGWLAFCFIWIITFLSINNLAEVIPMHFNFTGNADKFGSKDSLWLLPIIGSIVFLVLTILNKYPHTFNYLNKITEQNALAQYTLATKMIRYLKFIILIVFSSIIIMINIISSGEINSLSFWFLPLVLSFVFIPIIYFIIKMLKAK
jgi:uncharacterized membrane protein